MRGVFLSFRCGARQMIEQGRGGRLLATASIAAKMGSPFQSHYQASKSAVVGLVRSAAWELGQHGITVNCYCPGHRGHGHVEDHRPRAGEAAGEAAGRAVQGDGHPLPLGRTEVPEDVAPLVSFLASEDSRYITGQAINVCGGVVMW